MIVLGVHMSRFYKAKLFVLLLLPVLLVQLIGGVVTVPSVREWYPTLTLPAWTPPNWVFTPVWTALYLLMTIASYRIWIAIRGQGAEPLKHACMLLYFGQLALNLGWSLVFFGMRSPGAGLTEMAALIIAAAATTLCFYYKDRLASLLMLPYLAWLCYAFSLNAGIVLLNNGLVK